MSRARQPLPDIDLDAMLDPGALRPSAAEVAAQKAKAAEDKARIEDFARKSFVTTTTNPAPEAEAPLAPQKTFTVFLPLSVIRQVRNRAVAEDKPIRVVVLEALKLAGFAVADAELEDRRGIVMKRRARR